MPLLCVLRVLVSGRGCVRLTHIVAPGCARPVVVRRRAWTKEVKSATLLAGCMFGGWLSNLWS